ncbi:hypothetical protein QEH59_17250 [Coraliomargarita sp. SDUM461004]|uniref:Uncharacterized protein n=1 Tax=Thalassobacterium sedimentorum TaxID=3041258 RepID=A0ABU1AN12_9BACT|nr:hypothetical protein [Coraliomargarita sp. SDUM461004]MDQ8196185.1 hypothetical protein [Coraliomargarita sp. SDUM461004]
MALVISLVMMSLVLTLVITLGITIRVETQNAAITKRMFAARNNALLGLYAALGELQAAAGPDQRVTATAEILSGTDDANLRWTGVWNVEGNNPFDYSMGPRDLSGKLDPDDSVPAWLISSNNAVDPAQSIESVNVVGGSVQTATLVSDNSFASNDPSVETEVVAGRIQVGAGSKEVGGYAWWVGDEGIKSKLNTVDQTRVLEPTSASHNNRRDRLPLVVSLRAAGELVLDADANFPVNWMGLNNVWEGREMTLLTGEALDADWVKKSFYEATFVSSGVLSDVRNGGLKKDLSRGLGDQWQEFLQGLQPDSSEWVGGWPRPQPVFQIPGASGLFGAPYDGSIYGPYWDVLYHYANLYQPHQPWLPNMHRSSGHTFQGYMSGNAGPSGFSDRDSGNASLEPRGMGPDVQVYLPRHDFQYSNWQRGNWFALPPTIDSGNTYQTGNSGRREPVWNAVAPVMARLQLVFSLSSVAVTDPPPAAGEVNYRLRLHVTPAVVLWNPYNASLAGKRYSFSFEPILHLQIKVDGVDYLDGPSNGEYSLMDLLKVNGWGPNIDTDHSGNTFGDLGSLEHNQPMLLETDTVTFAPGEVKVFSLPSADIPWHPLMTRGSQNQNYWLKNEFNPTNSAFVDLVKYSTNGEFTGESSDAFDLPVITVMAGDSRDITVEFFAENVGTQFGNNGYLTVDGLDLNTEPNYFNSNTPVRMGGGLRYARFVTSDQTFNLGEVANLEGNSVTFAATYAGLKTTNEASDGVPLFSQFNVRALVSNKLIGNQDMPFTEIYKGGLLSATNTQLDIQESGGLSYYGSSFEPQGGGQQQIILFDAPRQPLYSVGELMHANVSYYDVLPQYAVGNSFASPYIPLDNYFATWEHDDGSAFPIVDYSYALNDALFDEYFFSGIPARYSRYSTSALSSLEGELPPYESFDLDYLKAGKPLPNSRMRIRAFADTATQDTLDRLQDIDTAAAHLMVDGAFNVNSTSVDAWKSILGSLALAPGETYPLSRSTGVTSQLPANEIAFPAPRFSLPVDDSSSRWTGFANMNDGEIETLAVNLVEEVKARGPFLSLGDFVNRRLTNDVTGKAGALQSAIDASNLNDTSDLGSSYNVSGDATSPYERMDSNQLAPAQGAGIPGWILQNDILRGLAPVLTVRSDTFRIRAYGDVEDPITGEIVSRAWVEAIVQRVPDFIDGTDSPETPVSLRTPGDIVRAPNPGLAEVNREFGRRFEIVSFRWLNKDEI